MRTRQRLEGLKAWVQRELCEGRKMKAPADGGDILKIVTQEPQCYIGWPPMFNRRTVDIDGDPMSSVCPGIVIMPNFGYAGYTEEERFDRYSNIIRPNELGQDFNVQLLFCVWEPGVRLPGFIDSAERPEGYDYSRFMEGTEQGIFTLTDWMDDCVSKMLGEKIIPGTDLSLQRRNTTYSLYTDQNYIVDKRPLFYAFVNAAFKGYDNEAVNPDIEAILQ